MGGLCGRDVTPDLLKNRMPQDIRRSVLRNRGSKNCGGLLQFRYQRRELRMSRQLALKRSELVSIEHAKNIEGRQFFSFLRAHA